MSQEDKGLGSQEMAGGHHRLNRHEFKQTQETVRKTEAGGAAVHGSRQESATEWRTTTATTVWMGTLDCLGV